MNFRTESMSTTNQNALKHILKWESSTGNLSDLSHIRTREFVEWDAPPPEFGGTGPYSRPGHHAGLGFAEASSGTGVDQHDIIPSKGDIKYTLPPNRKSARWTMRQKYQCSVNGGEWIDIPGSRYEITRWFKCKKGFLGFGSGTLVACVQKRGLDDGSVHKAKISLEKYFKNV